MIFRSDKYEGSLDRVELRVTTNKDGYGEGTLRWAINQTQDQRNYYDIIFETPKDSTATNTLGTGYWTIELNEPLPEITSSNIRINHKNTKNVVITSKGKENGWGNIKQANNSLMTIGDPRLLYADELYVYGGKFQNIQENRDNILLTPQVYLKNVHFIGHETSGESPGGGGGLGAGGAIVIFDGIVDIKNSTFQNLRSVGGIGKTFGYAAAGVGGDGLNNRWDTWGVRARGGWTGAPGGKPSFPVWSSNNYGPAWKYIDDSDSVLKFLKTRGGEGGKGLRFVIFNALADNANGKPGQDGKFGFGGGNGGGGGAIAFKDDDGLRAPWGKSSAGDGGNGGHLAGGGAGGGAGVSWVPGNNEKSGRGGQGYHPGENGSHTSKWKGGKSGTAGAGAGVGGAIAILQKESKLGTSSVALNLESVDFINTKSSDSLGDAIFLGGRAKTGLNYGLASLGLGSNAVLTLNDVRYAESYRGELVDILEHKNSSKIVTHGFSPIDKPHKVFRSATNAREILLANEKQAEQIDRINNKAKDNPFHFALSTPYKEDTIKMRDTVIDLKQGSPDIISIVYETKSSGEIGIYTDISDEKNPFNQIWQKLVPDKSSEIQAEYEASLSSDIFSLEKEGLELAKNLLMVNNLSQANTGAYNPYKSGGIQVVKGVAQVAFNHMQNEANNAAAEAKRINDIDANQTERREMIDMLNNYKSAQISTVVTKGDRTLVEINDFVVGEDLINLPFAKDNKPSITSSGEEDRVTIRASNNLRDESPIIATINIANMDEFDNRADPAKEIQKLLTYNDTINAYQISPYSTKKYLVNSITSFVGGPAHEYFKTDHSSLIVNKQQKISVQGKSGDDQFVGSVGYDELYGDDGNDIFTIGKNKNRVPADQIYGGTGIDALIFSVDQRPFKFISKTTEDNDVCNLLEVFDNETEPEAVPIASINGVETYEAFKGSYIDFSKFNAPCESFRYSASFGSGSQFIGSEYADNILLSFDDQVNDDGDTDDRWDLTSVIDGGGSDDDRLTLNFTGHDKPITLRGSQKAFKVFTGDHLLADVSNIEELVILGSESNDQFIISDIKDSHYYLDGGIGDDLIDTSKSNAKHYADGGDGSDSLVGGDGFDHFKGGDGDDLLQGFSGKDKLKGGKGDDILIGGEGPDVITGGPGSDVYIGGTGGDFFKLSSKGVDTIRDFNPKVDRIVVKDLEALNYEFSDWTNKGKIMGILISVDGNERMILEGVSSAQLDGTIFMT